jgi:hypothetical protein
MHRARAFNIIAASRGRLHKLLKLQFGSDGSIYAMIPQFSHSDGIVARVNLTRGLSYPTDVQLPQFGKVTSHIVKYSHHPDGRAHFSQDGRVLTEIKRSAAPLDVQRGHLFTMQVEPLSALPAPRANDKSFQLNVDFVPDAPRAVKLVAFRHPRSSVRINGDASGGPKVIMTEAAGELRPCFPVAPPLGFQFDSHVLLLTVQEIDRVSTDVGASLIFLGGFDETGVALDHSKELEFLAVAYPCSDYGELARRVGSIDLARHS